LSYYAAAPCEPALAATGLAEHLGYPGELLDPIPPEAVASFAGVGHHIDLAALRPGDVSGRALKERTRRNVDLWAACVGGAIPRRSYVEAIEAQGLEVEQVRGNDYRFVSERALEACSTYQVASVSLLAVNPRTG
jgi:hypothetical protein